MFDDDRDDRFDDPSFSIQAALEEITAPPPPPEPPAKPPDQPPSAKQFQPAAIDPSSLRARFPDVVPGLFPRETISLLVHSSYTGAKRFILPQLNNYANPADLPFLDIGIPGPREQLGMILVSGFPDEIDRRLRELNLTNLMAERAFPIVKWPVLKDQADYFKGIEAYLDDSYNKIHREADRSPGFLLIEDIHGMVPSKRVNDADVIIELFNTLKQFCIDKHCTILGTIAESKARPYGPTPNRILGTVQWARNSSSVLGLERYRKTDIRKLTIYSKTARCRFAPMWLDFGEYGRLNLCAAPESTRETKPDQLTAILELAEPGQEFTRADFQSWGMKRGIGERTVDSWRAECVDKGWLVKKGNGFQKPHAN